MQAESEFTCPVPRLQPQDQAAGPCSNEQDRVCTSPIPSASLENSLFGFLPQSRLPTGSRHEPAPCDLTGKTRSDSCSQCSSRTMFTTFHSPAPAQHLLTALKRVRAAPAWIEAAPTGGLVGWGVLTHHTPGCSHSTAPARAQASHGASAALGCFLPWF